MEQIKQNRWSTPKLPDLIFGTICLFLIFYIFSALTNTGFKFFIIRSGSMEPLVNVGDVAIITLTSDHSKIQTDDVIAFQSPYFEEPVIHRVIELTPEGYITKGDANEDLDIDPVSRDLVIGIYRFKIPVLGFFFVGIKNITQWAFNETRIGWMLIVIVPSFLFINSKLKKQILINKGKGKRER